MASGLSGSAGNCGPDSTELSNWLLRFGTASAALRLSFLRWIEWLANGTPPIAATRAIMSCRAVALDKQPGVRPVGIGEIY